MQRVAFSIFLKLRKIMVLEGQRNEPADRREWTRIGKGWKVERGSGVAKGYGATGFAGARGFKIDDPSHREQYTG